ncbi:glycosyltransferase family 2 protein [Sphaerimonospora thailandensis]|uniref:Glycosyl transferase n=1 Tax=Sphaerimonospora thailandensis TaxID=795644 RepID=A0A8J3R6M5_9ACTN|nr:glycosyltransferase [Sphaerimonospora thailandensis]GIH68790.1 glycosyl transferase [Sphaerimonospora thailandensis]
MSIALTIAVCSNRPATLPGAVDRILPLLDPEDWLLVVLDHPGSGPAAEVIGAAAQDGRVRLLHNGANLGLSASRNRALKEAPTRCLLFLDDDISPNTEALRAVRAALANGKHVVGTRITADLQGQQPPWFLSPGQLHYLGCHHPARPASIWGGCFGLDIAHARMLGVAFDERLGRVGASLASAEDTTFVRTLTDRGATAAVLYDTAVTHLIPAHRLRLHYLLRRAYWQGRSEVRRGNTRSGLRKEWQRNRPHHPARQPRQTALALFYTAAVTVGAVRELLVRRPVLEAKP